jgi:predicted GNAT family N-acyltransferase
MQAKYVIKTLSWQHEDQPLLKAVREEVFIQEQHVPFDIEWDAYDTDAIHLLALDENNHPIGCARILKQGRIGRMAVVKAWRGCGVGLALLHAALEQCKQMQMIKVSLSSQTHAIKFYQRAGFVVTSDAYIDANIWHVDMLRQL